MKDRVLLIIYQITFAYFFDKQNYVYLRPISKATQVNCSDKFMKPNACDHGYIICRPCAVEFLIKQKKQLTENAAEVDRLQKRQEQQTKEEELDLCFTIFWYIYEFLFLIIIFKMSQFRIQRKFTSYSSIKPKLPLPQPSRIRSLQSKHSLSVSAKQSDTQLRQFVKKIVPKKKSEETVPSLKFRVQQGIKAYKQKNILKAIQILKQVRKSGYKAAELSYYLGSCFLNLGKHQASIMYLNECISINRAYSASAYLYTAINFKLIGNLKQAVRELEEGLKLFPNFEEGEFYKGKLLMKLGQNQKALASFRRCLEQNPSNTLAILFLGDCLKAAGKTQKAIQKYKLIVTIHNNYADLAAIRAAAIMIQTKKYDQAHSLLMEAQKLNTENPEISYYLGLVCYHLSKQQSIVYFQACFSATKDHKLASKALKNIVKQCFEEGKFYEAEFQINRIEKLDLQLQKFESWRLLVESVNDLIKRKHSSACSKLQKAVEMETAILKSEPQRNTEQVHSFMKHAYLYLGYAFYTTNKVVESIQAYERALSYNENNEYILASKLVAQGSQLHANRNYERAIAKFSEAFQLEQRIEYIFMLCIGKVAELKQNQSLKQASINVLDKYFEVAAFLLNKRKYHLFVFYETLVLLYIDRNAVATIEQAIRDSDQPISEYYFIYALALYNAGKLSQSLDAISRAIELDPGIQEFYRERSKYYFIAEDFEAAIADCYKAESLAPEDEEIPLLLSFFLYLKDDFQPALSYLETIKPASGKLYQFELALCLRLGLYDRLQQIGQFLQALEQEAPIHSQLFALLEKFITERYQYSQFSVYFYHLLLGVGYSHNKDYEKSLSHFFGCLEEIQVLIDEKQKKESSYEVTWEETEAMLDQVKFNIVIASLLKGNHVQTQNFIQTFANETSTLELKQALFTLLGFLQDQSSQETIRLAIENDAPKLSGRFRELAIPLHHQKIKTKFLVSYPVKLKFTIAPQFDPAYLFNFDLDKVEHKIAPPWLKLPTKQVSFTNLVRNESVLLTQTQRSPRESQASCGRSNTVEQLRLDKQVEARLQKLMKK